MNSGGGEDERDESSSDSPHLPPGTDPREMDTVVGDPRIWLYGSRTEKNGFYHSAFDYWSKVPATVNGMLGGYEWMSEYELEISRKFLERFWPDRRGRVVDVACGIGRVSVGLLRHHFDHITLVEMVEAFVEKASSQLTELNVPHEAVCCGAQDWEIAGHFDVFWLQWILLFLADADAIAFLRRCAEHLSDGGRIIVKDNVVVNDFSFDDALIWPADRSCARTTKHYRDLFRRADLRIAREEVQEQKPEWDMCDVMFFVLVPTGPVATPPADPVPNG